MTQPIENPPTQPTVEEVVVGLKSISRALAIPGAVNVLLSSEWIDRAIALLSALEKLEKDALRYRWARSSRELKGTPEQRSAQISRFIRMGKDAFLYELPAEDYLDTAIDLARGKS